MSKFGELGAKLHSGEVGYDFIGKYKRWFIFSLLISAIAIGGLAVRGLHLGIEFKGGVEFQAATKVTGSTVPDFRGAVRDTGVEAASAPVVTTVGDDKVRIQTRPLEQGEITEVRNAIAAKAGIAPDQVNYSQIGASWGDQITKKALYALIAFLILVFLMIWAYFREPKASMAAIVALIHDVLITVGVYALIGFEVTPATVIGVLTILGYSLYDTVVVFDKVRENTRGITGSNRQTYSDATNLAVNQTLVRSINTTVIALLPISAILIVGTVVLGSGPLKDLSLALFIGVAAGAYSSIFIAPAMLALLKERESGMQALRRRVEARRANAARPEPVPATAGAKAAGAKAASAKSGRSQDTPRSQDTLAEPAAKSTTPAPKKAQKRPAKASSSRRPQPARKSRSKRRK